MVLDHDDSVQTSEDAKRRQQTGQILYMREHIRKRDNVRVAVPGNEARRLVLVEECLVHAVTSSYGLLSCVSGLNAKGDSVTPAERVEERAVIASYIQYLQTFYGALARLYGLD